MGYDIYILYVKETIRTEGEKTVDSEHVVSINDEFWKALDDMHDKVRTMCMEDGWMIVVENDKYCYAVTNKEQGVTLRYRIERYEVE